jgi:predicted phosphodiesterase
MSGRQAESGKIVEKYCKDKLYKKTPDLTLAKLLFAKYPAVFMTIENVRSRVRSYRGHGSPATRLKSDRISPSDIPPFTYNPFKGESFEKKNEPFHFPKSLKKLLLLSDIHFPYQNNKALNAAIKYGLDQDVDCIFLNGDILDCYQLSDHEKNPRNPPVAKEIEICKEFFTYLRSIFPNVPIYFIPGNHENRLKRVLMVKAPFFLGVAEFELPILLKMGEHKITYLEHMSKVYWGKLLIEHGDKMRGFGGVNPARTLLLKFKRPTICGHFHRSSQANGKVYDGDIQMAWSTGHLCEEEPDYMPLNEWNHGFAIIEKDKEGYFKVFNHQIINGKVY